MYCHKLRQSQSCCCYKNIIKFEQQLSHVMCDEQQRHLAPAARIWRMSHLLQLARQPQQIAPPRCSSHPKIDSVVLASNGKPTLIHTLCQFSLLLVTRGVTCIHTELLFEYSFIRQSSLVSLILLLLACLTVSCNRHSLG